MIFRRSLSTRRQLLELFNIPTPLGRHSCTVTCVVCWAYIHIPSREWVLDLIVELARRKLTLDKGVGVDF